MSDFPAVSLSLSESETKLEQKQTAASQRLLLLLRLPHVFLPRVAVNKQDLQDGCRCEWAANAALSIPAADSLPPKNHPRILAADVRYFFFFFFSSRRKRDQKATTGPRWGKGSRSAGATW